MEAANWALVFLTAALVVTTIWYAWESRQSRQVAARTLGELRVQNARGYDVHVVVSKWAGKDDVEVTNLGPAPALDIRLRCAYKDYYASGKAVYLTGHVTGLPVGGTMKIEMTQAEAFGDFPDIDEDLSVEVSARTVLGGEVKRARLRLPHPSRSVYETRGLVSM